MARLFAILIFMLGFLTLETQSTITISKSYCSNSSNFTVNSPYEVNLARLLASLASNASSSSGFFNTSQGNPGDPGYVYGRFLCRGDVTKDVCAECVNNASVSIKKICPMGKASILWFDECMLQYSDQNSLSPMDKAPLLGEYNGENAKEATEFKNVLNKTMKQLIARADKRSDKYASKEVSSKELSGTPLYIFAQCRPDLSAAQCEGCLQNVTSSLLTDQTGKIGGRKLLPTCFARFEIYPFYGKVLKNRPSSIRLAVGISSAIWAVALLCVVLCFIVRRERNKRNRVEEGPPVEIEMSELHFLRFDMCTIIEATSSFSSHNKLGEGGFGPVYRGTLPCGRKIAAKRLSQTSKQGVLEFENEVKLAVKLQHKNIVRLLGFSMEREEAIILYEYMPNGSLDQLLFDPQQRTQLDWSVRHKIVVGVAHGLLYLHEDSRLQIIHRDLKASNILLDDDMNPKISDFGMARSLGFEQTQQSTKRIAGTHGYMAPEYVMHGQFSIKSDVFSFGVLMLEVITGKKNRYSYVSDRDVSLLDYVWEHWKIGAFLEIVDPTMSESYSANEVIRCIHISLLCVQNDKETRPAMDAVVFMLSSTDSVNLPLPDQPAFVIPSVKNIQQFRDQNSNQSSKKLNSSKIMPQCSVASSCVSDVTPR